MTSDRTINVKLKNRSGVMILVTDATAGSDVIIFVQTSTHAPDGFKPATTTIAYKLGSGPVQLRSYQLTEMPALLAFMGVIVRDVEAGSHVIVHSRQNPFTSAFVKGWISAWKKDRFCTKPREHREKWAEFVAQTEEKHIRITPRLLSDSSVTQELSQALSNGGKIFEPHPGDAAENPWAKAESPDNLLARALEKKRK